MYAYMCMSIYMHAYMCAGIYQYVRACVCARGLRAHVRRWGPEGGASDTLCLSEY
jgi:hypothetical protein